VSLGDPSSERQPGCLGVFALEQPCAFTLAPEEGAGVTVRFTPRDARCGRKVNGLSACALPKPALTRARPQTTPIRADPADALVRARAYEASVPVFIHGDTSKPHLSLELAGTGRFPRLTFDSPEVLLPPVGTSSLLLLQRWLALGAETAGPSTAARVLACQHDSTRTPVPFQGCLQLSLPPAQTARWGRYRWACGHGRASLSSTMDTTASSSRPGRVWRMAALCIILRPSAGDHTPLLLALSAWAACASRMPVWGTPPVCSS
jgi:hypothetical protein